MTRSCESLQMDQIRDTICFSNLLNDQLQEIQFQIEFGLRSMLEQQKFLEVQTITNPQRI